MKTSYIAFLRGINVGGHTVKMERLRELFEELSLENVRSYINSGNLFFDTSEPDRSVLAKQIETHLIDVLGFEVPVFLRTPAEIQAVLAQDQFHGIELTPDRRFSVVFTANTLNTKLALPIYSTRGDMEIVALNPTEAFVVWHILDGHPPSGRFPENVLPARNTSRFYHTLGKILHAALSK